MTTEKKSRPGQPIHHVRSVVRTILAGLSALLADEGVTFPKWEEAPLWLRSKLEDLVIFLRDNPDTTAKEAREMYELGLPEPGSMPGYEPLPIAPRRIKNKKGQGRSNPWSGLNLRERARWEFVVMAAEQLYGAKEKEKRNEYRPNAGATKKKDS